MEILPQITAGDLLAIFVLLLLATAYWISSKGGSY